MYFVGLQRINACACRDLKTWALVRLASYLLAEGTLLREMTSLMTIERSSDYPLWFVLLWVRDFVSCPQGNLKQEWWCFKIIFMEDERSTDCRVMPVGQRVFLHMHGCKPPEKDGLVQKYRLEHKAPIAFLHSHWLWSHMAVTSRHADVFSLTSVVVNVSSWLDPFDKFQYVWLVYDCMKWWSDLSVSWGLLYLCFVSCQGHTECETHRNTNIGISLGLFVSCSMHGFHCQTCYVCSIRYCIFGGIWSDLLHIEEHVSTLYHPGKTDTVNPRNLLVLKLRSYNLINHKIFMLTISRHLKHRKCTM